MLVIMSILSNQIQNGNFNGARGSSAIDLAQLPPVIHLQFWAYESWDSMFPISMSPNCKLMSPTHYF